MLFGTCPDCISFILRTMFPQVQNVVQQIVNSIGNKPFTLEGLKGFPIDQYRAQQDIYSELTTWYKGTALNDTVQITKNGVKTNVSKYPLKINPLKKTVEKHVAVLMGSTPSNIRDGAMPVRFRPDLPAEEKERSEKIVKAIIKAFMTGGGGAMLMQNGFLSEYLGGSVLTSKFRNRQIETSNPHPSEFVGIPDGINYWRLREAWIVRKISADVLPSYGFTTDSFPRESEFWYVEHWTPKEYSVSINDIVIVDDEGIPMAGNNPFGVVPIEYIPHLRDEDFLGFGDISEAVRGLIREMNLRAADVGDAVSDDSHQIIYFDNVKEGIKSVTIDGRPMLNLGSSMGITANESKPEMATVKVSSASDVSLSFLDRLESYYRQEVSYPAVADGVDQGSQRSSKTLDARMWPLQSHVDLERVNLSIGLIFFVKIMLKMMAVKGLDGITMEDVDVPIILEWQPQLARDRDSLVNEVVQRTPGDNPTLSQRSAIAMMGNPNPDEELEQIQAEQKIRADLAAEQLKLKMQNTGDDSGSFGNQDKQKGDKQKEDKVSKE